MSAEAQAEAVIVRERGAELLAALETRVPGTRRHADATAIYAFAIAAELGLFRSRAELVREVARLHDVGKVYVPQNLLQRQGALSPAELGEVRLHVEHGYRLLQGAGIPEEACTWVLRHREHVDGSGYPAGLTIESIPLEARVIQVACAYDALRSDRPYWRGVPHSEAIAELRRRAGAQSDRVVLEALSAILERAELAELAAAGQGDEPR